LVVLVFDLSRRAKDFNTKTTKAFTKDTKESSGPHSSARLCCAFATHAGR
jgi:hypothetical protein